MQQPLTPLELLDIFLEWFILEQRFWGTDTPVLREHVTKSQIFNDAVKRFPVLNDEVNRLFVVQYFDAIIEQLAQDKYIVKDDNSKLNPQLPITYSVTFLAKIYWEKTKGYLAETKSINEEKSQVRNLAIRADKNASSLNTLTAILAIGTCALAIAEGVKIYYDNDCAFWSYILWVIIATTILLAILITSLWTGKRIFAKSKGQVKNL